KPDKLIILYCGGFRWAPYCHCDIITMRDRASVLSIVQLINNPPRTEDQWSYILGGGSGLLGEYPIFLVFLQSNWMRNALHLWRKLVKSQMITIQKPQAVWETFISIRGDLIRWSALLRRWIKSLWRRS